jgi:hypothetical protein
MAVPRGHYEIECYASFLKLHGKTYDYKVMYSSIVGVYSLPKPDMVRGMRWIKGEERRRALCAT